MRDGGLGSKILVELPFYACGIPHVRCLGGRTASYIESEKAKVPFS